MKVCCTFSCLTNPIYFCHRNTSELWHCPVFFEKSVLLWKKPCTCFPHLSCSAKEQLPHYQCACPWSSHSCAEIGTEEGGAPSLPATGSAEPTAASQSGYTLETLFWDRRWGEREEFVLFIVLVPAQYCFGLETTEHVTPCRGSVFQFCVPAHQRGWREIHTGFFLSEDARFLAQHSSLRDCFQDPPPA